MPNTTKIAQDCYNAQEIDKQNNGKYKHKKKYINGIYSMTEHEYVTPNGSDGLDVIFFKTQETKKYSKTISFGAEKKEREHDWREVVEDEY